MPGKKSRYDGHYSGPGKVVRETRYSICIEDGDEVHVFFKGTHALSASEWWEDLEGAAGQRVQNWDDELQWYIDHYGYQSDTVFYTGYSRGGALAQYMGGQGYGSATFHGYPARSGSQSLRAGNDWNPLHALNAWLHNEFIMPISSDISRAESVADNFTGHQVTAGPSQHIAIATPTVSRKRGRSDMHAIDEDHSSKRMRTNPLSPTGGDFSGLVKTFLNPSTGLIIGYKGIARKRKFHAAPQIQLDPLSVKAS